MIASWMLIALCGYMLLAVSGVLDKFLVTKVVREPVVYAFYTAITGPLSFVLAPFGLKGVDWPTFFAAMAAGIAFVAGIYFLYSAESQISISREIPIQGGLVPVFTLAFAFLLLGETLTLVQTVAFAFLVIGAVMISFRKERGHWVVKAIVASVLSAGLLALCSVLTKYVFIHTNFISGMIWTRLGFFIVALFILCFPRNRQVIFAAPKQAGAKHVALYYSSRASGTIGGFLQNYAVSLGSVTIVNALQGVEFVVLLLLTSFLSIYYPRVLKEKVSFSAIFLKLNAIALITVGLVLLVL
jgi:drug/metabolite transporter (DMT)-like permease